MLSFIHYIYLTIIIICVHFLSKWFMYKVSLQQKKSEHFTSPNCIKLNTLVNIHENDESLPCSCTSDNTSHCCILTKLIDVLEHDHDSSIYPNQENLPTKLQTLVKVLEWYHYSKKNILYTMTNRFKDNLYSTGYSSYLTPNDYNFEELITWTTS